MRSDIALAGLTEGIRFVSVDVETTPSDAGTRIISVGVVPWSHGGGTGKGTEFLVNPGVPIENTHIHGLANDTVANEPDFADVCGDISTKLTTRGPNERIVLVAHYARFDIPVLRSEFARAGMELPDLPVLDTWLLARHLDIKAGRFNLTSLTRHFGIPLDNHHNALADATATSALLVALLREAATQGHSVFEALHSTSHHDRRNTGDYDAASGSRAARRDAGSSFIYIERPIEHSATHTKMVSRPSAAALAQWLDGARECVQLRCPLLMGRCEQLPAGHEEVVPALVDELVGHLGSEDSVSANTVLGAICRLCARYLTTRNEAEDFYGTLAEALRGNARCARSGSEPTDACPDCRADRSCPADTWVQWVAGPSLRRSNFTRWLDKWTQPGGHLDATASTRPLLAQAQLASMYEVLKEKQADTTSVVDAAVRLNLVDPRLALADTRRIADTLGAQAGEERASSHLERRNGSTDRAWFDVDDYRNTLAARVAAAAKPRQERRYRLGRSRPDGSGSIRRFTKPPEG